MGVDEEGDIGVGRSRRRSEEAHQRRWARRFVRLNGFQDRRLNESINTLTRGDIRTALTGGFEAVCESVTTMFDEGEVLSDGRSEGTLQKVMDEDG